jgi:serine phosphatase RsbU (regulator of sigma subunit)
LPPFSGGQLLCLISRSTDGVTESLNAANEEFGVQRLVDSHLRHRSLPAELISRAVVDDVIAFSACVQI